MKRMKTFFIYALLIAAFWIVADLIIYLCVNGTYKSINTKIYMNSPYVTIEESKATSINGVIKGSIKNNATDIIDNMYLKIDMYSARNVNLGTKYVKIDDLKVNESQDFEMWYEFTNVNYLIITTTEDATNITEEQFSSQKITFYLLFGRLMYFYFFL